MQDPVTPTTSSIRDFFSRTSVPPSTLASSYRRNSRCPQVPSPLSTPLDADTTSSTITTNDSSFWSHNNDHTSSLTDIAIHLEANSRTPTKILQTTTKPQSTIYTPTNLKEEIEKELEPFKPLILPSSVTITRKRNRNARSMSPENARRSLSFYKEEFPSISTSMQQMPTHPAYDVTHAGNQSIFQRYLQHEHNQTQEQYPQTTAPAVKIEEPQKIEDTPMDLDIRPTPTLPDDNKENIDPTTFIPSSLQTILPEFNTPPHPDSKQILLHNITPIKNLLSRKKFEATKTNSQKLSDFSSPFVINDTKTISETWQTPDGKRGYRRRSEEDVRVFQDGSSDNGVLPDGIETPTIPPKKKNRGSLGFAVGVMEPPTGLVSKVGLLTAKRNIVFEPSFYSPMVSQYPVGIHNPPPPSSSSSFGYSHYTTSPIPPTPTPQKLLHKSAKSQALHNKTLTTLRNAKKLEELKMRFPRNMYDVGGRKKKDLIKLARKCEGFEEDDGFEVDENEWNDADLVGYDGESLYAGGESMVDVGWGI
ncbi:hypothetical protein TWF281_004102 [Arthrobotrys megalospora]